MKMLTTAFFFFLIIAAARAQTAAAISPVAAAPLGGYLVVFPQGPLTTIRFDGNSEDIAKVLSASRTNSSFNHDGKAFNSYVRSASSESYSANVVDYAQRDRNVAEYKNNVKSGKWIRFVNGQ
jgi:hypothetical protein